MDRNLHITAIITVLVLGILESSCDLLKLLTRMEVYHALREVIETQDPNI